MDVTTRLRLAACGGVLAMLIASTVLAKEVRIESGAYTLNGDFAGQTPGGRVVLIVHGTLGHKDMEVIEAWIRWLTEHGARTAILVAPPVTSAIISEDVLPTIESGSPDDRLEGIDFLRCKNANVNASTYLSYYGPAANNDTIALLQKISLPTLVLSGSQDEVVPELASRMSEVKNPLVTHIEISGAGHFFRDLFMYDVVDSVIDFMKRLPKPLLEF
jgi:hypothetical protein